MESCSGPERNSEETESVRIVLATIWDGVTQCTV
jgi:hypothetical protein